jgi:hypothetical protein
LKIKDKFLIEKSWDKFKQFVLNQTNQIFLQHKLNSYFNNEKQEFCRHFLDDLKIIKESTNLCNENQFVGSQDEFLKLLGFLSHVKVFDMYYEKKSQDQVFLFGTYYIVSVRNRINYSINQNVVPKDVRSLQNIYDFTIDDLTIQLHDEDLKKYREIIKVMNLANKTQYYNWHPTFSDEKIDFSNMKNSYSIYSHEESNQVMSSIVNRELDETQNETNFPILNSILLSLKIAE